MKAASQKTKFPFFKIDRLKGNTFYQIYFFILLPPIIILLIFSCISTFSYSHDRKALLKESYSYRLDAIYRQNESTLNSIIQSIHMLSNNSAFVKAAAGDVPLTPQETAAVRTILSQLVNSNEMIESVIIADRKNKQVLTSTEQLPINEFFYDAYPYQNYDMEFWKYYQAPLSTVRALSPTYVNKPGGTRLGIIPMVFTGVGDVKVSNLIILNISIPVLLSEQNQKLTKNSQFSIINRQTGQKFDANNDMENIVDTAFYKEISKNTYTTFDHASPQGEKLFIISYSPSSSLLGYSYAVSVPYRDINHSIYNLVFLLAALAVICFMAAVWLSRLSAKKIVGPLEHIASLLRKGGVQPPANILEFIQSSITEILASNTALSEKVSRALPALEERMIIDLLNSNEHYRTPDSGENSPVPDFTFDSFCSVIIKLQPTEDFYQTYTNVEYSHIQSGIYGIIRYTFSQRYNTYVIPSDTDVLYVLLNLPKEEKKEDILALIKEFHALLKNDAELLKLNIGIGEILTGLEGLKQSHTQAIRSVSSAENLRHIVLNLNKETPDTPQSDGFAFSFQDENTLLNLLLIGRSEAAMDFLDGVWKQNEACSGKARIQLNIQIMNIVFKVLRTKNIPYDEKGEGDIAIISDLVSMPPHKVQATIRELAEKISSYVSYTGTKLDMESAIDYIETHYQEELCLESLAAYFQTTPKHISRLLKEKLGVNFVDYLAAVRIEKAKYYLDNTKETITEIYEKTGFNNRNTFLRTFKKVTGLSPSEYRKNSIHPEG